MKIKQQCNFIEASRIIAFTLVLILGAALQVNVFSQNLIKNSGFEDGSISPGGWEIRGCTGEWSPGGYEGKMVSVFGNGKNSGGWYARCNGLTNGGIYRMIFMGKQETGTTRGCAVSGTISINRDYHFSDDWQEYSFYFRLPDTAADEMARVGQWQIIGKYYFDNVQLYPALPIHKKSANNIELGDGEFIKNNRYFFTPAYGWKGLNYHRPLYYFSCGFNSDRWTFSTDKELIYKLSVGNIPQTDGVCRVAINYYVKGALEVSVSKDLKTWTQIGVLNDTNRAGIWQIPSSFYPSVNIFVRLKCVDKDANFQVNSFEYNAGLASAIPDCFGETYFMDVIARNADTEFFLRHVDLEQKMNKWRVDFDIAYKGTNKHERLTVQCYSKVTGKPEQFSINLKEDKDGKRVSALQSVYFNVSESSQDALTILLKDEAGKVLFTGLIEVNTGVLNDPRPGYWLSENKDVVIWWCESGWKIGRNRGAPQKTSGSPTPIRISCSRNEYESAQVILTPLTEGELLSASAEFLPSGDSPPAVFVSFYEVAYVPVITPTDSSTMRGLYPDPLPPLKTPLKLAAHNNQPIWITVKVSEQAIPGNYNGHITLKTSFGEFKLPVVLTIYDFTLPKESHLRSAFGLSTYSINRYHKLQKQEDKELVYEKYLKNFAEHRISPYSFFDYHPIKITFIGEKTNKQAVVDFSRFDIAAEKWLDKFGFNSFRLPLKGMGGGTFHSRYLGELEGFKEGTSEHARLFKDYLSKIENHLRQRGWLEKAYTYWFDEPDKKDYEFVVEGMKRIKAAAPGIKRMLTEQPEPELIGHVDIWCGLTPEWNKDLVEQCRKRGEEVWWYICCGPKAPYITEFIDHPGTELRLWPWQSWQYGVQGILVWETTYWTSSCVYSNKLQNPWEDPMSYVSGYDFPVGYVGYWGNGDGRFLYPPRRNPNTSTEPCLDEPVNSIRWEQLRDGVEDYEYLWLLSKHCERVAKKQPDHPLLKKAQSLLVVPENISASLTKFTTDPREILNHREKIARMIEQIQKL